MIDYLLSWPAAACDAPPAPAGPAPWEGLIAMVTHELKNSLMTVQGYTELVMERKLEPASQARAAKYCQRSLDRAQAMVEELMVAASGRAGLLRIQHRPCGLGPVFDAAFQAVKPEADRSRVSLLVVCPADAWVRADPDRLELILVNLLSNAIRHVESGGRVVLAAHRVEESWQVEVTDDGCGMSARALQRLGVPVSGDATGLEMEPPEGSAPGHGLGLFVVKALLQAHDAPLQVVSNPGEGTSMRFRLPVGQPSA